MIIEAKSHNKYLKPKKKGARMGLHDCCLSLKLEADHPQEVSFLTALFNAYSPINGGGRVVIYRGRKKIAELTSPPPPAPAGKPREEEGNG